MSPQKTTKFKKIYIPKCYNFNMEKKRKNKLKGVRCHERKS